MIRPLGPDLDLFETPQALAETALRVIGEEYSGFAAVRRSTLLEPSAGSGNLIRAARAVLPSAPRITAVEINPAQAPLLQGVADEVACPSEFLSWSWLGPGRGRKWSLIIGNPPYSEGLAELFVERCLGLLCSGGRLIMHLRLEFLESAGRARFFEHEHEGLLVHSKRISYTGDGMADKYGRAWFVWRAGGAERRWWKVIP